MRIAILEEDPTQCDMLRWLLETAGHKCHPFGTWKTFQTGLYRDSFDLIVLEWMLPDQSGAHIVHWIRHTLHLSVPVLCISAHTDEETAVEALNSGADEFMCKPIRRNELVARVNALLRRAYPELNTHDVFHIAGMEFHPKLSTIVCRDTPQVFTQKEFDLALLLFQHLDKSISRSHIQEQVWGRGSDVPSRTLDTHISRVRTKLGLKPDNGFQLTPVYGFGYKLEKVANKEPKHAARPSIGG